MSKHPRLSERILAAGPVLEPSISEVFETIRARLTRAVNHGQLVTAPADVYRLLKLAQSHGITAKGHFERVDGAWFDFTVALAESPSGATLLGYNFEIRFDSVPGCCFVRFDLNLPGHPNEDHGVRSHLHPATDDLSVPSPFMSPIEILDLFIERMQPRTPGKLRR